MAEQLKSHDLQQVVKFAIALSTATERVNDLSAQLHTLATFSKAGALPIAAFTATTARVTIMSHAGATAGQDRGGVISKDSNQSSSLLEKALSVMFVGAAVVAAAKLWRDTSIWLAKTRIARAVVVRIAAAATGVRKVATGSEVLASIAAGVSDVLAGLPIPEDVLPSALAVNPTAIMSGVSHPAMTFIRNLSSVIAGEPGADADDTGNERGIAREGSRRRYALTPLRWTSIVTSLLRIRPSAFATLEQSQSGGGTQTLKMPFPGVATAMLALPLLVTPAITSVPSEQMRNDTTSATSIVINSAPTIVINSTEAEDIEPRILEVLRQHREAIYAQWCAELKRRQRTEF
jgi:hypothetical protein